MNTMTGFEWAGTYAWFPWFTLEDERRFGLYAMMEKLEIAPWETIICTRMEGTNNTFEVWVKR